MPEVDSTPVTLLGLVRFRGYFVDSSGAVWSCWKITKIPGRIGGSRSVLSNRLRRLTPAMSQGRPVVVLYPGRKQMLVHRLILEAFRGPCPKGMEACHFPDPSPANNNIWNLRWDTHANNVADKLLHGTDNRGSRHPVAKLNEDKVLAIRSLHSSGWRVIAIAKKYNITHSMVSNIVHRRRWTHI